MKNPKKPIEYAGKMTIEFNTAKAKEYIRNNLETKIEDVPLWVLLSLGIDEAMKAKRGNDK